MENNKLEQEKLQLERERIEIEKKRLDVEIRSPRKNLGILITGIVSLVAVIVSIGQVWVAHIDKAKEIKIQEIKDNQEINLKLAEFVMKNQSEIFSPDPEKNMRIRNVMVVTFPPDIIKALFSKLELASTGDSKSLWRDAKVFAETIKTGGALATNWAFPNTSPQSGLITICSFNIQFLGMSKARDEKAIAEILQGYDIVIIQELIAPPFEDTFPDGTLYRPDPESVEFFKAMESKGFSYVLSEEDTGTGDEIHLNSAATEWWVAFYKSEIIRKADDLPSGFLADDRSNNDDYERVPYAFAFRTVDHKLDFVLISVHLSVNQGRCEHELKTIGEWVKAHSRKEKDFIILGDMNILNKDEFNLVKPSGFETLNDEFYQTNTNDNKPMAFDHVLYSPFNTAEIDQDSDFKIIDLINEMKKYWNSESGDPYPGDPYNHNSFRSYYSDHHPIEFRLNIPVADDD